MAGAVAGAMAGAMAGAEAGVGALAAGAFVPLPLPVPGGQGLLLHAPHLGLLRVQPLLPLQQLLGVAPPLHQLLLSLRQEPGGRRASSDRAREGGRERRTDRRTDTEKRTAGVRSTDVIAAPHKPANTPSE